MPTMQKLEKFCFEEIGSKKRNIGVTKTSGEEKWPNPEANPQLLYDYRNAVNHEAKNNTQQTVLYDFQGNTLLHCAIFMVDKESFLNCLSHHEMPRLESNR